MTEFLRPSKEMRCLYAGYSVNGALTAMGVMSAIADRMGGYYISHTATLALRDLGLLTPTDRPNKKAKELLAKYLRGKLHNDNWGVAIADER